MNIISRRDILKASAYGISLAGLSGITPGSGIGAAGAVLADATIQRSWGVNTDVDVWRSYAPSLDSGIVNIFRLLNQTTLPLVREGLGSGSRGNNFDTIDWNLFFNGYAEALERTGRKMVLQVAAENIPSSSGQHDAAWAARVTHKFTLVARYLLANPGIRRAVAWLSVCNEPDYDFDHNWTIDEVVRLQALAYQAVKSVSADILVEGATFADPVGKRLSFDDLLKKGITRYCDFIGFHCYVQSADTHRQSPAILLRNMRAAHQNFGWPMRPLVCTETGLKKNFFDGRRGPTGWQALAHWQHFNYMQLARFGVSRCIYFSLGGTVDDMCLVEYANGFRPRPSFASMIAAVQPRPMSTLNGSFAIQEDKFSNWVVCYRPGSPLVVRNQYPEWSQSSFQRDGRHCAPAATDSGYLQLDRGRPKAVRRVLDGLSPRPYRVTAWVHQQGGTASLRVLGFDQTECDRLVEQTTTAVGRWVQLQVQFQPVRSLIGVDHRAVISLEHSGQAMCWWDSVGVTASR